CRKFYRGSGALVETLPGHGDCQTYSGAARACNKASRIRLRSQRRAVGCAFYDSVRAVEKRDFTELLIGQLVPIQHSVVAAIITEGEVGSRQAGIAVIPIAVPVKTQPGIFG